MTVPIRIQTARQPMRRAVAVNFNEIDQSESSGEASEDLETGPITGGRVFGASGGQSRVPVKRHWENIDTSFISKTESIALQFFDDDAMALSTLTTPTELDATSSIEPTESVILMIAHPLMYDKMDATERTNNHYLNWTSIADCLKSDFSAILHNSYKNGYQKFRNQLRFVHLASPSREKLKTLAGQRKETLTGRILFHYVGYGYNRVTDGAIYSCDGRPPTQSPYRISEIVSILKTPSWFIFDCDNAASFLEKIEQHTTDMAKAKGVAGSGASLDDWFCMCATGMNETLPENPHLPRDFLTTCLLNPVQLAVLCHILRYYRTSFRSPGFPLDELQGMLAACKDLESLLTSLVDAIAADYLTMDTFTKLFRRDKLVATYFRHFILAQRLLYPYEVHPVSHPHLPVMHRHALWRHWDMAIDIRITSTFTVMPSLTEGFHDRIVEAFRAMLKSGRSNDIKASILTGIAHMPVDDMSRNDEEVLLLLVDYVSKGEANKKSVAAAVWIQNYVTKLSHGVKNIVAHDAICYLLLTLMQHSMKCVSLIKKESDMMKVYNMILDPAINDRTRMLMTAMLACVAQNMRTIRVLLLDKRFFTTLKQMIPNVSSQFLLWLLILLKQAHGTNTCDLRMFYSDSVHIQIAEIVFHRAHECRAAALACLASFLHTYETVDNLQLLLMVIPAFCDMSYLVRFQLLLLVKKFLSGCDRETLAKHSKPRDRGGEEDEREGSYRANTFSSVHSKWLTSVHLKLSDLPSSAGEFVKACDTFVQDCDASSLGCDIALFLLDLFRYDPHASIQKLAHNVKTTLGTGVLTATIPRLGSTDVAYNSSVWSSGGRSGSDATEAEVADQDQTDSTALFTICLKRLVEGGLTGAKGSVRVDDNIIPANMVIPMVELQSMPMYQVKFNEKPTKIAYHLLDESMALVTDRCCIHYLNNKLETKSSINMPRGRISDLKVVEWGGNVYVLSCMTTGCSNIWKPGSRDVCATWRSSAHYYHVNALQYAATANNYTGIMTVCGTSSVCLWDVEQQRLVGEWPHHKSDGRDDASAICLDPGDARVAIVGYEGGSLITYDTRLSGASACVRTFNVGERVIGIQPNRNSGNFLYAGTQSGKCLSWQTNDTEYETWFDAGVPLEHFDTHRAYNLVAYASPNGPPVLQRTPTKAQSPQTPDSVRSTSGHGLLRSNHISALGFHPILPVITFGYDDGTLSSHSIL